MENGEITLVLGYECLSFENVLHALLHGIGFKDEVTHPHRDEYIRVLWNNIQPRYRHLYRKQSAMADGANIVEYDPLSIMQFHDRAFSVNGRATVIPLEPGLTISPSHSLSQLDRTRLQLHFSFECNKRIVSDLLNTCKASLGEVREKVKKS
ncbi:zinc metalloproteinase nas-6-like [Nymphalis io]|uniref:zinc metalloproteinase nas-6-like n=1 Tax=Inachis io TaxID=171585 RepID=UPI00216818C1|nr:zinc metalloproteinase nas-6-like [Nymphalis io]